ncbi:MAG: DUF4910 domain-containing protein [bacterium]|nr:DUF4910 domain-containing protein [bacterium]
MLKTIIERLSPEVSGSRAYHQVEEVARHHRIQASPGYRQAARHCLGFLTRAGLQSELVAYRADGQATYWGHPSFREWHAESASLWQTEPERRRLADYEECPLSLIQRSDSTPPGGFEAELAVVDDADRAESYHGRDVAGKLVLITGQAGLARHLAVERHGAAGLLVDQIPELPPVRRLMDLPDARVYTSFWETGGYTRPCSGFVVTPREGARLRRLAGRGTVVRLRAEVRSRFTEGTLENVEGFLPGLTGEEVLVVAHLCHPRPSANDNASGAGALLESARALAAVLRRGDLPAPQRGIRFLLVPEMTGTVAYLSGREDRIPLTVAALNLDMVGQRQDLCGSSLQVEREPRATPGFAGDLAAAILSALAADGRNFSGSSRYGLFCHTVTAFSGGSDHYILSDPSVGVPCPMVIQFPDRFYHTSEDTLDKVDPAMLERVALLAAVYAYWVAAAGEVEAAWLASLMTAGFAAELQAAPGEGFEAALAGAGEKQIATELAFARRRASFLLERKSADLRSLARLAGPEGVRFAEQRVGELERQAGSYRESLADLAAIAAGPPGSEDSPSAVDTGGVWEERARKMVPRRRFRGPAEPWYCLARIPPGDEQDQWLAFERDHRNSGLLRTLALYWADGCRSLADIADRVELETGRRETEYLVRSMELLARLELVDL